MPCSRAALGEEPLRPGHRGPLSEDQDGLQVLERIHQWFPQQKGIVASGHVPTERAEHAARNGLAWLAKPYTASALARSVQGALAA